MKFTSEIGILKGKFSYMSPEQIRGMPLDARTDVFSVGIILHEMLTTEKLFRGDTEFALMEKVRKAEVPPPSHFNRRVTPELDAITLKALARDVADRYQTAAALAASLDTLIAGYRFDPKELRQFVRQLFRREYAKELEETQISLEAEPVEQPSPRPAGSSQIAASQPSGPGGTPTEALPRGMAQRTDAQTEPSPPTYGGDSGPGGSGRGGGGSIADGSTGGGSTGSGTGTGPGPGPGPVNDRPRGFWASLFRKRK
jgi:serine/threonine protein kinase